jgi:hypothetical protein
MAFSGGFGGGGGAGFVGTPSAFGKPAGVFGVPPASPFGAPATSPSAFGVPAATSPFGSAPQPNAFNASPSGASPFGATSSPLRPQGAAFGGGGALGATGGQACACPFVNKGKLYLCLRASVAKIFSLHSPL